MLLVPLVAVVAVRALVPGASAHPFVQGTALPVAPVQDVPEDRTPEIRGHILDAEGNAAGGATVRLVLPGPPYTVLRDSRTDASGAFSFPRVSTYAARVVAERDPGGVVSSAEVHAAAGRTVEVTLVLAPASVVRGSVVDAQGHPVSGAALSVEGAPWITRTATSDDAGAFRLATVPQEATSLVAVARGYRTARVALASRSDLAELVVRVELEAAPGVQGDVLDVDGKPARARVVACEGSPSQARVASGEDGTFELPASAIGCTAIAQHDEYGPSDPVMVSIPGECSAPIISTELPSLLN